MKEVKEVVHVPTRGLAEKVLRVAKENGLMKILDVRDWEYYETETYFRPDKHGGYAKLEYAKTNGDTIITAEEFLNRYKPKFRPIAMRCNKEQFDAVRSKLVGLKVRNLSAFDDYPYLVNNICGEKGLISNVMDLDNSDYNRQVFEEWNEKTFLEYCGIEVKDEVNELEYLRKENAELKKHYNNVENELKQLNNELSKELGLVKHQLKELQDQPKIGDVCLFWDEGMNSYSLSVLKTVHLDNGYSFKNENGLHYTNCIKATDKNIQAKIKELQDEN